jgi:prevent-host-death family protein
MWIGDPICAIKSRNNPRRGPLMETFSIRDLRERTGELVREAEAGHLSIVAKHGRPLFVAVPMDEHLLKEGVRHCPGDPAFRREGREPR